MNQQSYIPGYPTMITETMYKPQEDYLFVNNLKVKEFMYDSKFKREAEGPYIRDYYQHYEADKPEPNSLYSPLHIPTKDINRQCNPYVAYPFGMPHKYKQEKCPKCKGNSTFGKKKRSKKNKNNENNDLFTSSLKKEDKELVTCWSNSLHSINKNKPHSTCVINSYAKGNFKTASFKSADPSDLIENEQKKKYSTLYQENFDYNSVKIDSNQIQEYAESNDLNKISSYQTEEYLIPTESYSRNSLSCFTDTNKSPNNKNSLLISHPKLYTMSNPISEEVIMSNEFNNSHIPSEPINEKSSSKSKGKLYLKLNNTRINEYSNIISSGVSENNVTDQLSERVKKTDDKTNKGRKKVKISVNRKIEKEKKEELINTNENNEIINDTIEIPKKKTIKSKINEMDIEKNVNKAKVNASVLSDLTLANEQDTKRNIKETTKRMKNKKATPIRKISLIPSTSARKASGETYLRMCKMQLAIDTQSKNKQTGTVSNKGMITSEEELFGSNSSRNTYTKSRVIYLQEKKKETNGKLTKEGNNNPNNNLLVSPRVKSVNSSVNSIPNSNLSVNTNISKNTNKSSNADVNTRTKTNEEATTNSSLSSNLKKKKIVSPNKMMEKVLLKENDEIKSKKEDILVSPRKPGNVNRINKIANKNIYQKKNLITSNLSNKTSNPLSDRKTNDKNSLITEVKNETVASKRITRKSVSGTVKNTNMSINKIVTNNNVSDLTKYKNGLLKNKIATTVKNNSENKKTGINSSNNNNANKTIIDLHIKKLPVVPLKKKKISVETQKVVGNKNISPQIKEENSGNLGSISDSALMNESDRTKPRMGVKFGRSETKLYMPNHKIVPFKTTEVKMITKKDSGKVKTKAVPKISSSDIAAQRRIKEQNKKKINTSTNIQPTYVNKNTIKGNLKNKKKELYDNILLLTKGINKKNDIETKTNGAGKRTKSSENKNFEHDSDSDPEISISKIKRSQTNKDKKKEIIKKDKKDTNRNLKKKEKVIEKKEKKVEDKE